MTEEEFRHALIEQRQRTRQSAQALVAAVEASDAVKFVNGLEQVDLSGAWPMALRGIARLRKPSRSFCLQMRELWIRDGDSLRGSANSDVDLINALRVLLPSYTGDPLTVFRGDSFFNRRRRTYGLSWSTEAHTAEGFAKGIWSEFNGGSVLLKTIAPADAVICILPKSADRYGEAEVLIDRRLLLDVEVLARFKQQPIGHIADAVD